MGSTLGIIFPINVNPSKILANSCLYTAHDPIYIVGNADFTPENGVTGGTGIQSDPYIIEEWDINASSANGIEVRNTDAYFIIRNCFVYDGRYNSNHGIYFYNVTNGGAENTNSSKNYDGIYLHSSNYNNIFNNNASNNRDFGVYLDHSNYSTLMNNTLKNNGIYIKGYGIEHFNTHNIDTTNTANGKPIYYYTNQKDINIDGWSAGQVILANCTDFVIKNVDCSNASVGVRLAYCSNCSIEDSIFNNETCGIWLSHSSNNNISNNGANSKNDHGIYLFNSSYNIIFNNSVNSNNKDGIYLGYSNNNNISNNNANSNNYCGIYLWYSNNNNISNNNDSNNDYGVYLVYSNNNNISNNNDSNNGCGICARSSSYNNIYNNNANSNNGCGIWLSHSSDNAVFNNKASNNSRYGIYLAYSSYNNIFNNNASNNSRYGIHLEYSSYSTLVNNALENNGIYIWGLGIEYFNTHNIDTTNTANGKPIYYYTNQKDINIDGWSAGQVILANCTGFIIKNVDCSNASIGVQVAYCNNCSIENSVFNNEWYGIRLDHSSYNSISKNRVNSNKWDGIYLFSSSYNNVFKNRASSNNGCGIWLNFLSNNNLLSNNSVSNNRFGIFLGSSLGPSNNNTVYNNNVNSNNYRGIYLSHSSNSIFTSNNISYNRCNVEIYSSSCKNNLFHHNNFIGSGVVNVTDNGANTKWDDNSGEGNYWGNYTSADDGSGGRTAGDGVGDINIPHMGLDNYPLMEPIGRRCMPPVISSVSISKITANSVTITWITDENSDSRVNYSVDVDLSSNSTEYDSTMTIVHSVTLTALNPNTTYYFEVISTDSYGNTATEDNITHYYTFKTEVPTTEESWWVLLLLIIIVAIIAIVVISKRKKGKVSAQQSDVSQTSETTPEQPSESEDTFEEKF